MATRVVYMSTPEFGIPTLRLLCEDSRFNLVGVVTQPDKPAGRGLMRTPPPIKGATKRLGVPVLQPASLRTAEAFHSIAALKPHLIAVAAYGLWIPDNIFNLPPKRSVNLHPSLLPRHRGAAPVMSAILAGDTEVGLSALFVEDEMDSGDLLGQLRVPLLPHDTTASVMSRLAEIGAPFFLEVLAQWVQGTITPAAQDQGLSTWIDRLPKEAGRIDWNLPALEIERRCRAFTPWPGTYTFYDSRRFLIRRARACSCASSPTGPDDALVAADTEPGRVLALDAGIAVSTGDGLLCLEVVQLAGRRAMPAHEFARGQRGFVGSRFD